MKTPRVVEYICKKFLPWFLWFHAAFWRESSLAIRLLKEVFTKGREKEVQLLFWRVYVSIWFLVQKVPTWGVFWTTVVDKRMVTVNNVVRHALFDSCPATASFCSQSKKSEVNKNHLKNFQVTGHLWRILCV